MSTTMRNLTLASAKHLLTEGHITPAHHARIVRAVRAPRPQAAPTVMAATPKAAGMLSGPMFGSMAPPASPQPEE